MFSFDFYAFGNFGLAFIIFLGFVITTAVVLIQFLLSPFLLDIFLCLFYGARLVDIEVLLEGVQEFIKNFCSKHKIRLPSKYGLLFPFGF